MFLGKKRLFSRKEFLKKCSIVNIPSDFIINVNVVNNYHINLHNHIYNNPEAIQDNRQVIVVNGQVDTFPSKKRKKAIGALPYPSFLDRLPTNF